MELTVSLVTLSAPEPVALARFYERLLGWPAEVEGPEWVTMRPPGGGTGLAFQREPSYRRPSWPAAPGEQQMMVHLDIRADDLERAVAHAVTAGATVADHQPQEDVRVCLDPDGHPFCLWVE